MGHSEIESAFYFALDISQSAERWRAVNQPLSPSSHTLGPPSSSFHASVDDRLGIGLDFDTALMDMYSEIIVLIISKRI